MHDRAATSGALSRELRDRAVRLVREGVSVYGSEWAAMRAVGEMLGPTTCLRDFLGHESRAMRAVGEMLGPTPETIRNWVRRAEVDAGERPGVTTAEQARIRELERQNFELRRANEILRSASIF